MDNYRPQPTYLDYRNSLRKVGDPRSAVPRTTNTTASPPLPAPTALRSNSRASSVSNYSSVSTAVSTAPAASTYAQSTNALSTHAPKPSPSPTPSSISTAPPPLASSQRTLTLVVATAQSAHIQQLLERLQNRYDFTAVTVLGPNEQLLKQTKMDIYTVAGKMSRNLAVYTGLIDLTNIGDLQQGLSKYARGNVAGVLCCLGGSEGTSGSGLGIDGADVDILDIDTQEIEASIRSSTLAIHTIARHALPLMSRQHATEDANPSFLPHNPHIHQLSFFLLDGATPTSTSTSNPIASGALETLVKALKRSPLSQGIDVGYAQDIVPAIPEKHPDRNLPIRIPSASNGIGNGGNRTPEPPSPMGGSESPTKLWSLWASYAE